MQYLLFVLAATLSLAACRSARRVAPQGLQFGYAVGPDTQKPGFVAVYGTLYNRGSGDLELLSETCDGLPTGLVFDSADFRRHARIQCFANWPVVVRLPAGDSLGFVARLEPLHVGTPPAFHYRALLVTGPYTPDSVRLGRLPAVKEVGLWKGSVR